MFLLRVAQSYITGAPFPDGSPYTGEIGKILWCEAEAAQALNFERAKAWGLPLDRILTPLDNPMMDIKLDKPEHAAAIAEMAMRPDVLMIVVDSLRGAYSKDENSSEIAEATKWLAQLARDSGKPVFLSHHLRKRGLLDSGDGVGIDRLRGSSSILQFARLIWALDTPDPDHRELKRLSVIKSNLARFPEPIGVMIDNEITFTEAPETPRTETIGGRAIDLLLSLLQGGPQTADDIQREFDQAGISLATMKRAKQKLGVISRKDAEGWSWALPAKDIKQ